MQSIITPGERCESRYKVRGGAVMYKQELRVYSTVDSRRRANEYLVVS